MGMALAQIRAVGAGKAQGSTPDVTRCRQPAHARHVIARKLPLTSFDGQAKKENRRNNMFYRSMQDKNRRDVALSVGDADELIRPYPT